MKKVLTVGVFDFFHLGHLNVLKQAKVFGDYLIVAVHDDKHNTKGVKFLYSLEERIQMVESVRVVDEVIVYERVDQIVKVANFDVFVHGPDQNHEYFQEAIKWCKENDKSVGTTKRTDGISSTKVRKILSHKDMI